MSRLKSLRPLYPSNKLHNVRYCVMIAHTHSSRMKNACSKFILVWNMQIMFGEGIFTNLCRSCFERQSSSCCGGSSTHLSKKDIRIHQYTKILSSIFPKKVQNSQIVHKRDNSTRTPSLHVHIESNLPY